MRNYATVKVHQETQYKSFVTGSVMINDNYESRLIKKSSHKTSDHMTFSPKIFNQYDPEKS